MFMLTWRRQYGENRHQALPRTSELENWFRLVRAVGRIDPLYTGEPMPAA
jgi:hypothetical protein